MLTASELKAVLREHGVRLSKRLGQHHLIDARAIARVVEACGVTRADTVVEIGAGLGALTEPLAERAGRVIAVEVDARIGALLKARLAGRPQVAVVCQDILTFHWNAVPHAVVVGAIPYQLTSPILASLCEARATIARAIVILQEEVAQRLLARPGTKAYGRLTVLAQYGWDISRVGAIGRAAFFPQPAVESVCLRLTPRARPAVEVPDERLFFAIVKAAFAQRRKTLVNGLRAWSQERIPRQRLAGLVTQLGLAADVRGEALSLPQFAALTRLLVPVPGSSRSDVSGEVPGTGSVLQ